jgi:hypothetical protein
MISNSTEKILLPCGLKTPHSNYGESQCKELLFFIFARLILLQAAGNTLAIHLIPRCGRLIYLTSIQEGKPFLYSESLYSINM